MDEEQRKQLANALIDFARAVRRDEVDALIESITPKEGEEPSEELVSRVDVFAALKAAFSL